MVQEFVYGMYASLNEAEAAVEELTEKGVSRSGIKLLANEDVVNHAHTTTPIEAIDDLTKKTSHWWDGLLDFFTFDTPHHDRSDAERKIDLSGYKDNVDAGKVLVIVDGAFENAAYHVNLAATTPLTTPDLTSDTDDQLIDDSRDATHEAGFIESGDVTVIDSTESPLPNVENSGADTDGLVTDVPTSLPEHSEESVESLTEPSEPEYSEGIESTNLPNNLYNPHSGASMADEPGVNIEEFENLTEKEVEQLDRVDTMDDLDQAEIAPAVGQEAVEFETDEVEVVEATEEDTYLDDATEPYGDPTIHQEEVEGQPRSFNDLRHPRENITPADVQRTIDEIRDPK